MLKLFLGQHSSAFNVWCRHCFLVSEVWMATWCPSIGQCCCTDHLALERPRSAKLWHRSLLCASAEGDAYDLWRKTSMHMHQSPNLFWLTLLKIAVCLTGSLKDSL